MGCIRIQNGFICGIPDKIVDMTPYGARVWMEIHSYLGPIFFRSKNATEEMIPGRKCWAAYEKWRKEERK